MTTGKGLFGTNGVGFNVKFSTSMTMSIPITLYNICNMYVCEKKCSIRENTEDASYVPLQSSARQRLETGGARHRATTQRHPPKTAIKLLFLPITLTGDTLRHEAVLLRAPNRCEQCRISYVSCCSGSPQLFESSRYQLL